MCNPEETLAFISELAIELAHMADKNQFETLGYLLRLAALEAQQRAPSHSGSSDELNTRVG